MAEGEVSRIEGIIIKFQKKRDLSNCRNWRGVTLLIVISKI
jgi:hypothetical protein